MASGTVGSPPGTAAVPGPSAIVRSSWPATTSSTSSAMRRKPVSLPPAIEIMPPGPTVTSSLRDISLGSLPCWAMRGRTPAHAATTSDATSGSMSKYFGSGLSR